MVSYTNDVNLHVHLGVTDLHHDTAKRAREPDQSQINLLTPIALFAARGMTPPPRHPPTSSIDCSVPLPMRAIESSNESGSSVTVGSTRLSPSAAATGTSDGDEDIQGLPHRSLRDPAVALDLSRDPAGSGKHVVDGLFFHCVASPERHGAGRDAGTKARTKGAGGRRSTKHTKPIVHMDGFIGPVICERSLRRRNRCGPQRKPCASNRKRDYHG